MHINQGCGTAQHKADCLCDVRVTRPTPIVSDLHAGWFVSRIMNAAGLEPPLQGADLLEFLELWVIVHDAAQTVNERMSSTSWAVGVEPWRRHAHRRFAEGATTTTVRAEVRRMFGVEMSASHASHMRRRLLERVA